MDALRKRLDALSAPPVEGEDNDTDLTVASFRELKSQVGLLEGKIADLDAKIIKLSGGKDPFPAPFDILADEIALNRSGLAEVNPPSIERGQISVVVANAGHGQHSTPDFTPNSPTTGDPLELPWDAAAGVFGP